jgi:16S rRNA processing protein RimM
VQKRSVLVGIITGAHGIKGEVKLTSFTADPRAIASYGSLRTEAGQTIEILRLRPQKQGFIAVLKGVGDRNQAEGLAGVELFVARERLPAPGDNEVYIHDLVGLAVCSSDGVAFGQIVAVANYGAGDLLEVKRPGRTETVFIPFSDMFVPDVNLAAGRLSIELPDGYLDET